MIRATMITCRASRNGRCREVAHERRHGCQHSSAQGVGSLRHRVVRLMLGGTEPSRIMCLTFTKAAAAEMANRLFDQLSKWIGLDDDALRKELHGLGARDAGQPVLERARQLFTRALETPGGLKIQTIHAFCE